MHPARRRGAPLKLDELATGELPELREFFAALSMSLPAGNVEQFSSPRKGPAGDVVTLVMRESDRIVGTIGWLDVPLRVNDERGFARDDGSADRVRWPVNLYLLPEYRGKGLGKQLMQATREGAPVRAVIGGNSSSMPVLDRTGWQAIGSMVCARWSWPCLDPHRFADRISTGIATSRPMTVTAVTTRPPRLGSTVRGLGRRSPR